MGVLKRFVLILFAKTWHSPCNQKSGYEQFLVSCKSPKNYINIYIYTIYTLHYISLYYIRLDYRPTTSMYYLETQKKHEHGRFLSRKTCKTMVVCSHGTCIYIYITLGPQKP